MNHPWILDYDTENCTIGAALGIVGEKWTFLVLREAFNGVRRFDDIRRRTGAPRQVLSDRLEVMDASAIDLARGSSIPIYIFSLKEPGNIRRALLGEDIGSMVSDDLRETTRVS